MHVQTPEGKTLNYKRAFKLTLGVFPPILFITLADNFELIKLHNK